MNVENISISIDPAPIIPLVRTMIREEMVPTLYDSSHPVAQVVQEEIDQSPRIRDRISEIASGVFTDKISNDAYVRDEIGDMVTERLSSDRMLRRVAQEINLMDLAAEIDSNAVAEEISLRDIASELSLSDIADEISLSDLAGEIEIDVETVVQQLDYSKLAKAILDEIRREAIESVAKS